jgi:hypothetical protein
LVKRKFASSLLSHPKDSQSSTPGPKKSHGFNFGDDVDSIPSETKPSETFRKTMIDSESKAKKGYV